MANLDFLSALSQVPGGLAKGLETRKRGQREQQLHDLQITEMNQMMRARERQMGEQQELAARMKRPYSQILTEQYGLAPPGETTVPTESQAGAQDVLGALGPYAQVPLGDIDQLARLRQLQMQGTEQAYITGERERMEEPVPGYYGDVYPGMPPEATRREFEDLQSGLMQQDRLGMQALGGMGGGGMDTQMGNFLMRMQETVAPQAMNWTISMDRERGGDLEERLSPFRDPISGEINYEQAISAMNPMEQNELWRLQGDLMNRQLSQWFSGSQQEVQGIPQEAPQEVPPGAPLGAMQQPGMLPEEMQQGRREAFLGAHPGAANLPWMQTPGAEYAMGFIEPGQDLGQAMEEIRSEYLRRSPVAQREARKPPKKRKPTTGRMY